MSQTPYQRKAMPALLRSVEHWERLRDGEGEEGEEPSADDCACCQAFRDDDENCGDCPITLRTGAEHCHETPYQDARREYDNHGSGGVDGDIQKEIDFLLGTRRLVQLGIVTPEGK